MRTFAKAQAASFIASLFDYLVTIIMVEVCGFNYVAGSSAGTVFGGLVNFSVSRQWVFNCKHTHRNMQLLYFGVVWLGYWLLITCGMFFFTHYLYINYIVSKVVVSLVLALFYNYPLQRKFIFTKARQ